MLELARSKTIASNFWFVGQGCVVYWRSMTLFQYDKSLNQSYKSSVLDGLASGLGWLLHLSLALGRPYLFPRGIQSGAWDSNLHS